MRVLIHFYNFSGTPTSLHNYMIIEENEITKSVLKNKESPFILLYRTRTQKKQFYLKYVSIGAQNDFFKKRGSPE